MSGVGGLLIFGRLYLSSPCKPTKQAGQTSLPLKIIAGAVQIFCRFEFDPSVSLLNLCSAETCREWHMVAFLRWRSKDEVRSDHSPWCCCTPWKWKMCNFQQLIWMGQQPKNIQKQRAQLCLNQSPNSHISVLGSKPSTFPGAVGVAKRHVKRCNWSSFYGRKTQNGAKL